MWFFGCSSRRGSNSCGLHIARNCHCWANLARNCGASFWHPSRLDGAQGWSLNNGTSGPNGDCGLPGNRVSDRRHHGLCGRSNGWGCWGGHDAGWWLLDGRGWGANGSNRGGCGMDLPSDTFGERRLLISNVPAHHRVAELGRHGALLGRGFYATDVRHAILVQ